MIAAGVALAARALLELGERLIVGLVSAIVEVPYTGRRERVGIQVPLANRSPSGSGNGTTASAEWYRFELTSGLTRHACR